MTDTFAAPSAPSTSAGSKLYQTWVASAAEAAMVERRRARRAAEREYRLLSAAAFPLFRLAYYIQLGALWLGSLVAGYPLDYFYIYGAGIFG